MEVGLWALGKRNIPRAHNSKPLNGKIATPPATPKRESKLRPQVGHPVDKSPATRPPALLELPAILDKDFALKASIETEIPKSTLKVPCVNEEDSDTKEKEATMSVPVKESI